MKRNTHATEQSAKITLDKSGPHGGQPAQTAATSSYGHGRTFLKSLDRNFSPRGLPYERRRRRRPPRTPQRGLGRRRSAKYGELEHAARKAFRPAGDCESHVTALNRCHFIELNSVVRVVLGLVHSGRKGLAVRGYLDLVLPDPGLGSLRIRSLRLRAARADASSSAFRILPSASNGIISQSIPSV
jgi:hypothetical protein